MLKYTKPARTVIKCCASNSFVEFFFSNARNLQRTACFFVVIIRIKNFWCVQNILKLTRKYFKYFGMISSSLICPALILMRSYELEKWEEENGQPLQFQLNTTWHCTAKLQWLIQEDIIEIGISFPSPSLWCYKYKPLLTTRWIFTKL